MDAATRQLVLALIRHGKGVISAVEKWVEASDDAARIGYPVRRGHASDAAGIPATSSDTSPSDHTVGGYGHG